MYTYWTQMIYPALSVAPSPHITPGREVNNSPNEFSWMRWNDRNKHKVVPRQHIRSQRYVCDEAGMGGARKPCTTKRRQRTRAHSRAENMLSLNVCHSLYTGLLHYGQNSTHWRASQRVISWPAVHRVTTRMLQPRAMMTVAEHNIVELSVCFEC